MSIDSMTGYGRGVGRSDRWAVEIQCKSVNHKRLEIRVNNDEEFGQVEPRVREAIRQRMHRGRVDVQVEFDARASGAEDDDGDVIDTKRYRTVARELQQAAESTGTGPVSVGDVLEFREFIEVDREERIDLDGEPFDSALQTAVDEMLAARRSEGEALVRDIRHHLDRLSTSVSSYKQRAPEEAAKLKERVTSRVRESLETADQEFDISEKRIAKELVMRAERADVSEEIARTESHIVGIRELLESPEPPIGKRLDFYLQELVRETNTLASKSTSAETTDIAVDMKTIVEKMREQAANVE